MKKTRPDSRIRVMIYSECLEHEKEIIQIEPANTTEGYKPSYMVEYGGSSDEDLRKKFFEMFMEEFQEDKHPLMGRKCSDWIKEAKEKTEFEQKKYDLEITIEKIKAHFCLPEVTDEMKVETYNKLKTFFEAYNG